jgi:DNA replication protein DnaC
MVLSRNPYDTLCYPDCPNCGGVGYVRYDVPTWDPRFGKLQICPNAQRRALEISLETGDIDPRVGLLPEEIREMNWDLIHDGINDAPKALQAVRSAYNAGHGMVFLYGASGQAKTLLLKIAVALAFRDGRTAAYADMRAVLDDIRLAYDEKENKQSELVRRMEWWLSRQVLAIDELDKVNSTDWAVERIFHLIDQRYQRAVRGEALTIIAANYNRLDELSSYLRSRIEDNRFAARGWVIRLEGPDGRRFVPLDWHY